MQAQIIKPPSHARRLAAFDPWSSGMARTGDLVVAVSIPFLGVAAITGIGFLVTDLIASKNISMLYLAAVVLSAVAGGGLSAVLAAALSFFAFNYFFIEPRSTFSVAHPDEVLSLVMFVVVALVTGSLAAQLRMQAAAAREQARATQALYAFSRSLSGALNLDAVAETIVATQTRTLGADTALLLPDASGELSVVATSDGGMPETEAIEAARRIFAMSGEPDPKYQGGEGTDLHLLMSGVRRLGIILLRDVDGNGRSGDASHLEAMLEQAAVALDRALWVRESASAAVAREAQKLQSALLSSLSHDLKTPLASITGAATSLQQLGDRMDDATRRDLLQSIAEDAGRLNRFVGNLFDMTRIESGGLRVRREAVDLIEIVQHVTRRVAQLHPELTIHTDAETVPPVVGDAQLIEQALFNVIDNARKYAGENRPVALRVTRLGDAVRLSITDRGPGIPAHEIERIFEKFYRGTKGDGRPPGTGLGLSIARGFVSAMGGDIRAESPVEGKGGTRFIIDLPTVQGPA